jgi:hypothetical protein
MQYTLLCKFGVYLDDDTPANTLLYFYSSYRKDENEEKNRQQNKPHQAPKHKTRNFVPRRS